MLKLLCLRLNVMEKVFLLVVVLSGNTQLSNRNLHVQKSTWMKHAEKDVKVLTLSGSDEFNYIENHLNVVSGEDYSSISFKTLNGFQWISENIEFDYLYRTNTSSYIDIKKLQLFCRSNTSDYLYRGIKVSNYFKDQYISYVSGSDILLSRKAFNLLIENSENWEIDLVDDVSIGKILQKSNVPIEESKSIIFDNSFFKKTSFEHEYHFRCRVDSPFYFPRFLDKTLLKYIHRELDKDKIFFYKRFFYYIYFNFCRIFAFQKHYDFVTYYFFLIAKKIFKK